MRCASVACAILTCALSACAARGSGEVETPRQEEDSPISQVDVEAGAGDAGGEPALDPRLQPGVCGDQVCNANETCEGCTPDCGRCLVCELAPSCSGALAIPTGHKTLPTFDNGGRSIYESGVDESGASLGPLLEDTNCVAPELRMRIRQINLVSDGAWGSVDMYCIISASDGAHSEVMVTPLQKGVSDMNPALLFRPEESIFWGQGLRWQTLSNLTLTYQCFNAVSNQSYKMVFDSIKEGSLEAGGVAGEFGWAFGTASVASGLIAAAIPLGQDELRINVQQTIDASVLLDLTNGRRWYIAGTGDSPQWFAGTWDWRLEIESWGCSVARSRVN